MHPATILILLCTTAAIAFAAKQKLFPINDRLAIPCPDCTAVTRVSGATCPDCNTRERILLRSGAPAGAARPMHILLYHCQCSSRMHFCDLKCQACGAKLSHDRRTEMRPLHSYDGPKRRAADRESLLPHTSRVTRSIDAASASAHS